MLVASSTAVSADWISSHLFLPHFLVDATAYLAHGIGAYPFLKYAEPVWAILMGVAQRAEQVVEAVEEIAPVVAEVVE